MPPLSSRISLQLLCRVLSLDRATRAHAIAELSSAESAASVLALANAENILPAFFDAISGFPESLPKPERIALAMAFAANRRRNRQISDAIVEIARASNRHAIPVAALKGARWIMEDATDFAAWRSMIDIDLLVPVENYGAMRGILEQLGYRAMRRERDFFGQMRFAGHYHLVALRRDDQPFATEVHRHVQWQPALLPTEAVFADSHQVAPGLRLPCPWHAALHAIVHWQIHHYGCRLGFHRVTDGLDIARFLCRDDVDWNALAGHAGRVGIIREVEDGLATVSELFGVPLPKGFQISTKARQYVAKALRMQNSRLLKWQAKQRQRVDRLWHDHRYLYRSELRKSGPTRTCIGLWALRMRRLPFLISHLASIAVLEVLAKLQSAVRSR